MTSKKWVQNWMVLKVNGLKIELHGKWTVFKGNGPKDGRWLHTQLKLWIFDIIICSTVYTWLGRKGVTCSRKNLQWMFYMTGDLTTIKQVQFELSSRNWKKEKRHECFNQPQSYYISHSINLHSSLSNHRMKNHLSQPLSN